MKLLIQIPCLNEASTLPLVVRDLPKTIPGIDRIETLIIDDGSNDGTAEIAKSLGINYIIRHTSNLGLAFAFRSGVDAGLKAGADIIVNIDGDNQYRGSDISNLIQPILSGQADMTVGDREPRTIKHFSLTKRLLQSFGSWVVRRLSRTNVRDCTSGFRAFSRDAAIKITILSLYSYTLESILQARSKGLTIANVKVGTNPKTRDSRLMSSMRSYLTFSMATIIRVFTMYNPLRVFVDIGSVFLLFGGFLTLRFLYFYFTEGSRGLIQSLIIAAVLILTGISIVLFGLIADSIQFSRRLMEDCLERIKRLELETLTKKNC